MELLTALIIPILSFFLQSYPRFFNKYFGVDVWTRLLEIDHVRNSGHKIPGKINKGFIIGGYFDYPITFPWIFSFLNKKTVLKIQGYISPFFDILQNILVFAVAYQFSNSTIFSITAQLVYALTPILAIENSYMTPRSMGYLNFTLAFLPLIVFHINPQMIYLLVSIFFTTSLFLTHRFALQALFFITIFFTFVDLSLVYLFVFILGFILATFVTKGYYLRILRGHLYNIYFWVKNYDLRFSHQIYGNSKKTKLDWVGKIYSLMSLLSPILLFSMDIWSASGFAYIILSKLEYIPQNEFIMKLSIWTAFFYIFGAIILKVKKLIPIGEGQRYLEMATVPSALVSVYIYYILLEQLGIFVGFIFIFILLTNLILILFVQIKGIIFDKNRSLTEDLKKTYIFINKLSPKPRIMCIPHQITTMTIYNTKADVLVNADNKGLMELADFFPVLKKSLNDIALKYNLSHILIRESFVKLNDLKILRKDIIFESGDIKLIRVKKIKSN